MVAPRTSSCSPWITGDDLAGQETVQRATTELLAMAAKSTSTSTLTQESVDVILANAANAATEILYRLSGRQFTGRCGPVTIRPTARPVDVDARAATSRSWSYGAFGSTSMNTGGMPPVVSQWGKQYPPTLELHDAPIREIIQVKIDGVVIPSDEYELRDFRHLVRMRPTANSTPTERWGWPTSQLTDLPDTEVGTFSVTYMYGADPGDSGRLACLRLAEALAMPQFGDSSHYPTRITAFTRQGVSAQVASVIDVIKQKGSGIYEVDLWLLAVNPNGSRRRAVVFSPDRVPNRRQARPSMPS